jgi:hypothetical protein
VPQAVVITAGCWECWLLLKSMILCILLFKSFLLWQSRGRRAALDVPAAGRNHFERGIGGKWYNIDTCSGLP